MRKYPLIHKPKQVLLRLPQLQSCIIGEGTFYRQTGAECFAHIILQLEPNPDQDGCFMLWSVEDNYILAQASVPGAESETIPDIYLQDVYEGLCKAMTEPDEETMSPIQYVPFPYENTNVRIIGGEYRPWQAKGMCYGRVASLALAQAVSQLYRFSS